MSHFIDTKLRVRSVNGSLAEALREMGYPQVEEHETPVELMDWRGNPTGRVANVIVRREHVSKSHGVLGVPSSTSSNDLGFLRTEDGDYAVSVDLSGIVGYNRDEQQAWLDRLQDLSTAHALMAEAALAGCVATRETDPDGAIRVTVYDNE